MISRQEAKAQGLKHYFTGKPCPAGHLSERLVSNMTCCQCHLERSKTSEVKAQRTAYYHKNREELLAKQAEYNRANRTEILAKQAEYHQANRTEILAKQAAYQKSNPHISNARNAKRKAAKLQATPPWADLEAIKAIYEQAAFITKVTGESNHVDHIIPLQGKTVCGLHVHTNLQILTATDNVKKSNKLLLAYETPEPAVE